MKILFILFVLVVTLIAAVQMYSMSAQRNIETYPYEVVKSFENFEIRRYEASLFTSVKLPTSEYKSASNRGFSILAGYIFGGNEKKEKIAMTSPVAMSLEDSMRVMFLVPKKYDKASLPKPDQSAIEFNEVPAKTVAAITFGGWADDEKISTYRKRLIENLDSNNIAHNNRFYFLGYNPPYEMINRKNEVIVELTSDIPPAIK